MLNISTLLWLWLFVLYAAYPVLAHNIANVTVTTTSTLFISVFDFAPTTHLTLTHPTSMTAYSNTSIQALAATPTVTPNIYISSEIYHALESTGPIILAITPTAIATSTVAYEKEDKEGNDHEPYPHTTSPPQSKAAKPAWVNPSTAALLCFDFLASTFFVWCWVMGWFSWLRGDQDHASVMGQARGQAYRVGEARDSGMQVLANQNVEQEMRRLGMV